MIWDLNPGSCTGPPKHPNGSEPLGLRAAAIGLLFWGMNVSETKGKSEVNVGPNLETHLLLYYPNRDSLISLSTFIRSMFVCGFPVVALCLFLLSQLVGFSLRCSKGASVPMVPGPIAVLEANLLGAKFSPIAYDVLSGHIFRVYSQAPDSVIPYLHQGSDPDSFHSGET